MGFAIMPVVTYGEILSTTFALIALIGIVVLWVRSRCQLRRLIAIESKLKTRDHMPADLEFVKAQLLEIERVIERRGLRRRADRHEQDPNVDLTRFGDADGRFGIEE